MIRRVRICEGGGMDGEFGNEGGGGGGQKKGFFYLLTFAFLL